MNDNQGNGNRSNLRDLLLIPGLFSLFLNGLLPVLQRLGSSGRVNPVFLLLVGSPWLLAVLVLLVDRPNPFKLWLGPIVLATVAPALALHHDWHVLSLSPGALRTSGLLTLELNVLLIGFFSLFMAKMLPCDARGVKKSH
jgi:hypothetical protein